MPTRSSSLGNNVVTGIAREIGSQYSKVKIVAENIESVVTVADSIDSVNFVAENIAEVASIGGSVPEIRVVAENIASVNAVSADIANVNIVAANADAIDTIITDVLPNIDEIAQSAANAGIASAKALEASVSASDALASATSASASELAAGTSATNAATSESVATSKAAEALASAVVAQDQATSASANAGVAVTKAGEASTSASNALTSETSAGLAASSASTSENLAQKWANELEDVVVQSGEYSAFHWAQKAEGQAGIATTKAGEAVAAASGASVSEIIATTQAGIATTKASEAAASASAASASEVAATAALEDFDSRYLGSSSVDPTVDNHGQPLQDGVLYFNTAENALKVYDLGTTTWYSISQSTLAALLDVQLTSLTTGEILKWDGSKWVNGLVTKAQVGLDNVDNTADATKAVLSATKLATSRNISVSGDATGSVAFDGSADANITVTVVDDSHTHDSRYYTETEMDVTLATKEPNLPATPISPTTNFLRGDRTWAEIVVGSGGYASNLYMTSTTSTVVGTYLQTSYTLQGSATTVSGVANNNEVLVATYLYEQPVAVTTLDAGSWYGTLFASVSSIAGGSFIRFQAFTRTVGGVETNLFSVTTPAITSTAGAYVRVETSQPAFTVNTTDRVGYRVYVSTTATNNRTISYIVGDGNASYFNTPVAVRHSQLRNVEQAGTGVTDGHINAGAQTIAGVKTFISSPIVPTPANATDASSKGYVDTTVAGYVPRATSSVNKVAKFSSTTGDIVDSNLVSNASGDLGLNVSPSLWHASVRALETAGGAIFNEDTTGFRSIQNGYYSVGGIYTYKTTAPATLYAQDSGIHTWSTASSGTSGTTITFAEKMRLDDSGALTLAGAVVGLKESAVAMAANDVNLSLGNMFTKTISGATVLTVSNVGASGIANSFVLKVTNGGAGAITYPTGTKWAGGTAPVLTTSGVDYLGFISIDGGTTWGGFVMAKDSK